MFDSIPFGGQLISNFSWSNVADYKCACHFTPKWREIKDLIIGHDFNLIHMILDASSILNILRGISVNFIQLFVHRQQRASNKVK